MLSARLAGRGSPADLVPCTSCWQPAEVHQVSASTWAWSSRLEMTRGGQPGPGSSQSGCWAVFPSMTPSALSPWLLASNPAFSFALRGPSSRGTEPTSPSQSTVHPRAAVGHAGHAPLSSPLLPQPPRFLLVSSNLKSLQNNRHHSYNPEADSFTVQRLTNKRPEENCAGPLTAGLCFLARC